MRTTFQSYFQVLQTEITNIMEMIEGKSKFLHHEYQTTSHQKGTINILKNGQVLDKGCLNYYDYRWSVNSNNKFSSYLEDNRAHTLYQTGLKVVFHPKNPNAPAVQSRWEYNESRDGSDTILGQWIAGEMNLIPHYLINEDASYFHRVCREVCDQYNPEWYASFKEKCDQYYWSTLREETLGIGGIYFEGLKPTAAHDLKNLFAFIKDLGEAFIPAYMPILEKRKDAPSVQKHLHWQSFRRSRFTEFDFLFNSHFVDLVKESKNPDALFAELPPKADFNYHLTPEEGSREAKLIQILKSPREWV